MGFKRLCTVLILSTMCFSVNGCNSEKVVCKDIIDVDLSEVGVGETIDDAIILVDDEVVKIAIRDKVDSDLGATLVFYVENKSENSIVVQSKEVLVDGKELEPIFSESIEPGRKVRESRMLLMGRNDVKSLKSIEGLITVVNKEMTKKYGEYSFEIS